MQILINHELIKFEDNLYVDNKKISFKEGKKVSVNKKVKYIVPGFLDQHIHGAGGVDTMDGSRESMDVMSNILVKEGTTGFLATTMTYDLNIVQDIVDNVKIMMNEVQGAKINGIHLEGPFISEKHIGAQNPNYVETPSVDKLKKINKSNLIKVVTYAPEEDVDFEFTKYLKQNKIVASIGHSDASCDCVNEAIESGLNSFTHFHNASTGHHHRNPGVVSSGLMNKEVNVELIVDGIHLNPTVVKLIYNIKGYENITLITDAMRAKSMNDGEYDLGGQKVYKKGREARLSDGTLAGSVLKMNEAVKNMISFSGCKVVEGFEMASYNVAKLLKLENIGEIKSGFDFNITMLDENFEIISTYVEGEKIYERGE